jgi:hypothetical protein
MKQFLVHVNIKCLNFLKIPEIGIPLRVCRGNRHQSPHPDMGPLQGGLRCGEDFLRCKAALGSLPADVHLQQDVLHQPPGRGHFLDLVQQLQRAHGLDQGHMAHHLLDFVALQVADEVQGGAVVGVLLQLLYHLLHPVLPQGVDAGCHGLPAGGGIVHLAGAHQQDFLRVPAGLPGRRVHVRPDPGNVLRNCHQRSNTPFQRPPCGHLSVSCQSPFHHTGHRR